MNCRMHFNIGIIPFLLVVGLVVSFARGEDASYIADEDLETDGAAEVFKDDQVPLPPDDLIVEEEIIETYAETMPFGVGTTAILERSETLLELLQECVRQPFQSVLQIELTVAEWATLENADCQSCQKEGQRLQIGINKPVRVELTLRAEKGKHIPAEGRSVSKGHLNKIGDDVLAWTMKIESPGAGGLRLFFDKLQLPADIAMYWFTEDGEVFGPYTQANVLPSGDFWSNTLSGSEGYLVVVAEGEASHDAFYESGFTLAEVAVLRPEFEVDFQNQESSVVPLALPSCIVDGSCYGTGDFSYINSLRNAIALLIFSKGGGSYICTGGLVNTSPSTFIPYLLTANHCFNTSASASSLECIWDFRTPSCNEGYTDYANRSGYPRTLGGELLATGTETDYTFVRLYGTMPGGRSFLGWTTATPTNNQTLYRISHPQGAQQSYSTQSVTTNPPFTCTDCPLSNYLYSLRIEGGIAGGSSGSPIVNVSNQIMGQLWGACYQTGCDTVCGGNCLRVLDGRFSVTFDHLRQWLLHCPTPPSYTFTISPGTQWQVTETRGLDAGACHVYRMYLVSGSDYDFTVCINDAVGGSWTGSGDGDLRMFNSAGTSLWYIDGSSACDYDASTLGTAYAGWSPPSDGYYYLKVNDYYSNQMAAYILAYRGGSSAPATPPNPTASTNTCGDKTLTRSGSPPSGVTWYWQGTSCGTRTDLGSGTTYTATASGTYYIRALDNTSGLWSSGCGSVIVTVNPVPSNPPNPTVSTNTCGDKTLTRVGAGLKML